LAQLTYTAGALRDIERLADFLIDADAAVAVEAVELIVEAVEVLANHPLVGRKAEKGYRELIISWGPSGYIALYSYERQQDTVLILAVRHQREAGYSDEG
jgi:addiction module RelE/StbE family toxin